MIVRFLARVVAFFMVVGSVLLLGVTGILATAELIGVRYEDIPSDESTYTTAAWVWTFIYWAVAIGVIVAAVLIWRRADRFGRPS